MVTPEVQHAYEIAKALRYRNETDDSSDLFMTGMVLYVAEKSNRQAELRKVKDALDSVLKPQVDKVRASRRSNAEMRRTLLLICGLFGLADEEAESILSTSRIRIPLDELLELADEKGLATD